MSRSSPLHRLLDGRGDDAGRRRGVPARLRAGVARRFSIDARALAAFRIGLGALLLCDLALRARNLRTFYTDSGVLPRSALATTDSLSARLSIHVLSGDVWFQAALFAVAGLVALALLVGYRSRLAALVSLFLLISLQARNPYVLNGGDLVLRHLLFWAVLLPLGVRWGLDAGTPAARHRLARHRAASHGDVGDDGGGDGDDGRGSGAVAGRRIATVATAGLLLQVVLIYAVNAVFKSRGERWLDGDAVRHVFSLEQFSYLLGPTLAEFPELLVATNYAWMALVGLSPLLIALSGRLRTALVAAFAASHVGMGLTMRLGLFPHVMLLALVPFLPPGVWNWASERVAALRRVVDDRLLDRSGVGGGALGTDGSGLSGIVARLGAADGSARIGGIGPAATLWLRRITAVVAAIAVVSMLAWNGAGLGYVGDDVAASADVDPRDHAWTMFAPDPLGADTDYEATGRVAGAEGEEATVDVTVPFVETSRWRKYLSANVPPTPALKPPLAAELCERWSATHEGTLAEIEIVHLSQPTRLDGPEPVHRSTVWNGSCAAVAR